MKRSLFPKVFTLLAVLIFIAVSCSSGSSEKKPEEPIPSADEDAGELTDADVSDSEDEPDEAAETESDADPSEESDTDTDEKNDEEQEIPEEEKIKSVVIGTYNTHLFFDKLCDSGNCENSDFESVPSEAEYKAKVSDLADSVREIGADIILLQEVEKESCLKDLFEKSGDYDEFYLGEKGSPASIDTGVMTKGEITYKNKHTETIECAGCDGEKTTFSHTFLEVHIKLGGRNIVVFSAHFKSKADDDASRRLAEAAAAAKILKNAAVKYPDALIVMGGDLNDEPGSDTLGSLESEPEFLRVADELPVKDQATYYYSGEAIALDHIFWVKSGSGSYKQGSAEVVKDAPSWYSLGSSDHAALKATFEF